MDLDTTLFKSPSDPNTLRIVPIGGVGEFGMNMTAYLYRGRLLVVDCGVRFPDPFKLGVNAVIPDVSPFFSHAGGVFAYVMTHGHEDHIGAIPYILTKWPAPIYATAWTLELIKIKLRRLGISPESYALHEVTAGDRIKAADFEIEMVHVNHSIPMSCALVIRTPSVSVFHTGDFKLDPNPLIEPPFDHMLLDAIGDSGIDLLVTDSTNAEKEGRSTSEREVLTPLIDVFSKCSGSIICSTFSSNLWRIKMIADACLATGKRLFIAGAGIEQTLALGKSLGIYQIPDALLTCEEDLRSVSREKLVILATGCQGEWRSVLVRLSAGEYKAFRVKPDDTLVLSARMIPGNEKPILNMVNGFLRQGASIVTPKDAPGIHVSGHGYRGDIELLTQLIKPRRFLPVHGTISQLLANRRIALSQAQNQESSILAQNGDVLDLSPFQLAHAGTLSIPLEYVDTDSSIPLKAEVLRERLKIGELGLVILTGHYDAPSRRWLAQPHIEFVGLSLPEGLSFTEWHKTETQRIADLIPQFLLGRLLSIQQVMEETRVYLRRKMHQILKKKPVVLVKIHIT